MYTAPWRYTFVGRYCGTLVGHVVGHCKITCRTLLCDPFVRHPCGAFLWGTLVGYFCRTLVRHSCKRLLLDTTETLLWDIVGHSAGQPPLINPAHQ